MVESWLCEMVGVGDDIIEVGGVWCIEKGLWWCEEWENSVFG